MNNSAKSKRLDKIELQLTPKQWAIRLADEMRRYPSQEDFLKVIGKGSYRQSLCTMPFYALAQQAEERWPEDNRREVELSSKLRMEFQCLKLLIYNINSDILIRTERYRLMEALQASKLHTLILTGAFVHMGVASILSTSSASLARLSHFSLLDDWANDSAMILAETIAYKAAVQTIQENYFERHPILFKDFETPLEAIIQGVRDGIAIFDKYRKDLTDLSNRESDQEQQKAGMANAIPFERKSTLPIDIEAIEKRAEMSVNFIVQKWVKNAKISGTTDILRETGKHEDIVWEQFQKDMGLKS
jgi:hypothetical protein